MPNLKINMSITKPDPSTFTCKVSYNIVFESVQSDVLEMDPVHELEVSVYKNNAETPIETPILVEHVSEKVSGTGTMWAGQCELEVTNLLHMFSSVGVYASITYRTRASSLTNWNTHTLSKDASVTAEAYKVPAIAENSTVNAEINGTNKLRIGIIKAYSVCSHIITIEFGSEKQEVTTSGTVYEYTVPKSWMNEIPDATSGTVKIKVQAIRNKKEVGYAVYKYGTLSVPKEVIPLPGEMELLRIDEKVPTAWEIYVQANSKVKATLSGYQGIYGSTIKEVVIKANNITYENQEVIGPFLLPGEVEIQGYVVDSRGRKSNVLTQIIVIHQYSIPMITNEQAVRYLNGEENDEGTEIRTKADYTYSAMDGKNSVSTKLLIRHVDAETDIDEGAWTSGVEKILNTECSIESRYRVVFQIEDQINAVEKIVMIETAKVLMDFKNGGRGMAIGKVAEYDDLFDVGMDAVFRENATFVVNGKEYTMAQIIEKLGI